MSKDYQAFRAKIPHYAGDVLRVEWRVGGRKGRSWDGCEYGDTHPEAEPRFDILDEVLLAVAPSLGILQYKAIERELVRYGSHQRDDYYGYHEDLAYKEVFLIDLHAWLLERDLLASP